MNTAVNIAPPLPDHTLRFDKVTEADIALDETVLVFADATEDRAQLPIWNNIRSQNRKIILVKFYSNEEIIADIGGTHSHPVSVRDEEALFNLFNVPKLLIDLSGFPHFIWAPLLKMVYVKKIPTRVLYAEPEKYKLHASPSSSSIFDLSSNFDGLGPLPGFARLNGPEDETKCIFIALLGFEGNRPERILLQIDPTPKLIPVVGVPGFKLNFPAYTIACNRDVLENYRAYSEIHYAKASCPFEAFRVLNSIKKNYPGYYFYVAPVGTKPHSLGAILFALENPDCTEILYDNPVRKPGRTSGMGVIHIYDLSKNYQ
jgi:hypothetical protein